ncbi:hypothetical protein H0H92_004050 [Tricholoma furcatifolium]|nr:hypothetical protein H0H92_004050 [Tricholoma furcatifolium]
MLENDSFCAMIRPLVTHLVLDIGEHALEFAPFIQRLSTCLTPRSLELYIFNETEDEDDDPDFDPSSLQFEKPTTYIWQDQTAFLGCFPTIVSLTLTIYCDTFRQVVELITSLPLLKDLKLYGNWRQSGDEEVVFPNQIRSLSLHTQDTIFLDWFLQHQPVQTPSSLHLRIDTNPFASSQLLRQAGSSLNHLSIQSLVPSDNPDIRSLKLIVWCDAVPIALRLLSQIPVGTGGSTNVETVEFQVWSSDSSSGASNLFWEEFDLLLTSLRFAKLRTVKVDVFMEHVAGIEKRLPRISSRKLLWLRKETCDALP